MVCEFDRHPHPGPCIQVGRKARCYQRERHPIEHGVRVHSGEKTKRSGRALTPRTRPALLRRTDVPDDTLFPVPDLPPALSAGQKLTKRNNDLIARGKHPATLLPLLGSDQTCGDCAHHHHYTHRAGSYHKCDQHRLGESHSAASDVRVGWPACVRFEAVD